MAAVDVAVVPVSAAHRADGGGGSATATVAPLAPAVCIAAAAASAYVVPPLLSYYATLAVSLVCFARAAWPDLVDDVLAAARRTASLARADLEADLRRLRCPARLARAAVAVAGWREKAVATWNEHADGEAARAAGLVLRLAALVARLAATVLLDAARDEARAWAPSVLGFLRRVVDAIRWPSPSCTCFKGRDDESAAEAEAEAGLVLEDVVCLVGTGFYVLFTMHLLFGGSSAAAAASGKQVCAMCFAACCGLAMVIVDWIWIYPPYDDADDDETDDGLPESDGDGDAAGDGDSDGETGWGWGWDEEIELQVQQSWRFLWVLVLVTHCVDAFVLHVTLGPRPATLAILALCNLGVLKAGMRAQLTPPPPPPDDDGEEGAAADGVVKWCRGATVVYAASSVKTLVVYLVLDCYMAALGFLWLFAMAYLLLDEEDGLLDLFDLGEEDDGDREEEKESGRGAEGEVDEEATNREEHANTSSSEDQEESAALRDDNGSSEDGEESPAHCDASEEHETHCGSDGSTDDGWDLVDVDPVDMPAEANCGAKRRKFRLVPWKHVA